MPDEDRPDFHEVEVDEEEKAELFAGGDTIVTADEDFDPDSYEEGVTAQLPPPPGEVPEAFNVGDVYESPFKDNDDLMAKAAAALRVGREKGLAEDEAPAVKGSALHLEGDDG